MKLEVGKLYETRGGSKCFVSFYDKKRHSYKFVGIIEGEDCSQRFTEDGRFDLEYTSPADLISEWPSTPAKNPVIYDRSLLPAWANKAIAMDENGDWYCFGSTPHPLEGAWDSQYGWSLEIPEEYYPQWSGDWKDSLLVFEGPTI